MIMIASIDVAPSRTPITSVPVPMPRYAFTALNSTFIVDSEYEFVKELGQGVYGSVVAAKHHRSGEGCAIKKITSINTKRILTERCLRKIKYVS